MLNEMARELVGYGMLRDRLMGLVTAKEVEDLESDQLKVMAVALQSEAEIEGLKLDAWSHRDWRVLLLDVRRGKLWDAHEAMTAEAILDALPWAAQQGAQDAVCILLRKAAERKILRMDETAEAVSEILWHMFSCMEIDIDEAAIAMQRKGFPYYSGEDIHDNKILLHFIRELRERQWAISGTVVRLRTRDD